ncbi:MAG: subclass B3 metallo-beta-lactamase [Acidobacteria bacterium]|nr:subclass B3 metallo-beta-lactamase [Acidobacteriota bacterium]
MRRTCVAASILIALAVPLTGDDPASWTQPVEPFRVIGNVWYVGTADLTSWLITSREGHILIDAPMEENVSHILGAIRKLGFDPRDVEIMLNSHAHYDHAGGFARMKEATGARLLVSEADARLIESGGRGDFAFGDDATFPPVKVDGFVLDEEVIELGGVRLTAMATPGHTKGSTSWLLDVVEVGKKYRVLFANSLSAPGYRLVGNDSYPEIIEDYRRSFERLGSVDADVLLTTHGSFIQLQRKIEAMKAGGPNPFIDPAATKSYVERWRLRFEEELARQRKARGRV